MQTLVRELAMQIAAASPSYATREEVPADVIEQEKNIYRAQMENSGKPANVIEKIVEGKLGSFYGVSRAADQPSIRDPKTTVTQVIAEAGKAIGAPLRVSALRALQGRRSQPNVVSDQLRVAQAALGRRWFAALVAAAALHVGPRPVYCRPPCPLISAFSSSCPAKP